MQGLIVVHEEPEAGRPHQGNNHLFSVWFEGFPILMAGDQFGFQTHNGKIRCSGLIVHARTFLGLDHEGQEMWKLHCVPYVMRAGFSVIPDELVKKIKRTRKPVVPERSRTPC